MSRRFRILLSAACGALALVCCLAYGQSERHDAEAAREELLARYGGETTQILVAAHALEPGDVIDSQSCEVREWLTDLVPEGSFGDLEQVRGSRVTSPVSQGSPLTEVMLRESEQSLEIPAGEVAIEVPVTEKSGLPMAADLGTQLVAYRAVDGQTRLVSAEVSVIARVAGDDTVTVAVPLDDVSALIQAATDGSLRFVQPSLDVAPTEAGESSRDETAQTTSSDKSDEREGTSHG